MTGRPTDGKPVQRLQGCYHGLHVETADPQQKGVIPPPVTVFVNQKNMSAKVQNGVLPELRFLSSRIVIEQKRCQLR
jgi:hypothetical protein